MEDANKVNVYVCEKCGSHTVTVNRDAGTTPFIIKCRGFFGGCDGSAMSSFYRVDQSLKPGWEWYKPENLSELDEAVKAHVENGGLLLQKLDAIRLERYGFMTRQG